MLISWPKNSVGALAVVVLTLFVGCSSEQSPTAPSSPIPNAGNLNLIYSDSGIVVYSDTSITDSIEFSLVVEDSLSDRGRMDQALASWQDGWRIGYGWDYDGDFYIDYNTRRSCCYRVSYTYALYYALRAANKPLIVYAYRSNVDGTISWRIIIGASALRHISPVADWFLSWQAKMQYYG